MAAEINKFFYRGEHVNLIYDGNDYVADQVAQHGFFDQFLKDIYDRCLTPDSVVVEVGAHIGTHTVYISKKVRQVFAFEPQPYLWLNLCANLYLNDCFNVLPIREACGSHRGFLKANSTEAEYMKSPQKASISFSPSESENDFLRVAVRPLDDHQIPWVDFLKIDTEGMDYQVLQGSFQLLSDCRPFICFEDSSNNPEPFKSLLSSLEYIIIRIADGNYLGVTAEKIIDFHKKGIFKIND